MWQILGGVCFFLGLNKVYTTENEGMLPEKGPFQKKRVVFQPSFFQEDTDTDGRNPKQPPGMYKTF